MKQYFHHQSSSKKLHKLKPIGSFHSSASFALKPRYEVDGSVTFLVRMWIPSCIWFFFAIGTIVVVTEVYMSNPQNNTTSITSTLLILTGSITVFFLLCGFYTLRLWRSVTIEQSGQVHFNIPRIIGRRRFTLEPESVWLDLVARIRHGKKGFHLKLSRNILERLNPTAPLSTSTPTLVIHDKTNGFILSHDKPLEIESLQQTLNSDYNLKESGNQYVINFSGILDEGWA